MSLLFGSEYGVALVLTVYLPAKTIGFAKSGLAQSIYAELKEYRINKPMVPKKVQAAEEPKVEKP